MTKTSTAPFTLRGLAGASPLPPRWRDSVLVVVDAQRAHEDGILRLPGMATARCSLAEILAAARAAGLR